MNPKDSCDQKIKENFDEIILNMNLKYDNDTSYLHQLQEVFAQNEDEICWISTAKNIFIDDYSRNLLENILLNKYINTTGLSVKDVIKLEREIARQTWKDMKDEEKAEYSEKIKPKKEFYDNLTRSNPLRINAYNLFAKDMIIKSREQGLENLLNVVKVAEIWRNSNENVKEIYSHYADILREERSKQQFGFDLTSGLGRSTSLPSGPMKFFVKDLLKKEHWTKNEMMKESNKRWNELPNSEKDKYIIMYKKEKAEYIAKKKEYVSHLRKNSQRPRTAFIIFLETIKSKIVSKTYRLGDLFEAAFEEWDCLEAEIKDQYEELAEKERNERTISGQSLEQKKKGEMNNKRKLSEMNSFSSGSSKRGKYSK